MNDGDIEEVRRDVESSIVYPEESPGHRHIHNYRRQEAGPDHGNSQRLRHSYFSRTAAAKTSLLPLHNSNVGSRLDKMSVHSETNTNNGSENGDTFSMNHRNQANDPNSSVPVESREDPYFRQYPSSSQPPNNRRRKKTLAGKVKASVTRPARAVGRRFKGVRSGARIGVADEPPVLLCRDVGENTHEKIFRENPLGEDALRIINGEADPGPHIDRRSSFQRSWSRLMSSQRSLSGMKTPNSSNRNRETSVTAMSPTNGSTRNHENNPVDDDSDWPVRSVEYITRHIALLSGAYALGASHPEWSSTVLHMLQFIVTAWGTCWVILALGWIRKLRLPGDYPLQWQHQYSPQYTSVSSEQQPMDRPMEELSEPENDHSETKPLLQQKQQDRDAGNYGASSFGITEAMEPKSKSDKDETDKSNNATEQQQLLNGLTIDTTSSYEGDSSFVRKQDDPIDNPPTQHEVEHPSLDSFYIVDSFTGQRLQSNCSTPFRISNEWMDMDMLVMLRTPDTDEPSAVRGTASNDRVSEYLRGKQRRFEFQYQLKLKKTPVGKRFYFSCELNEPIKMGIVTKAFVSAAMAFVKSTNPTFHYNITGSKKKTADGSYENPHMAFTIEGSVDRFVVTKPGETPPPLGSALYEDPEAMKKRKSSNSTDWNTEDTYTLALWSSYVDFLDWKCLNLPGIKPFGLSSVMGAQAINLTMYFIDEDLQRGNHFRKDLTEIIKLELSNGKHSSTGKEAKKWIQSESVQERHDDAPVEDQEIGPSFSRNSLFSDDSCGFSLPHCNSAELLEGSIHQPLPNDEAEEVDEDIADAAELGEGIYLRSGDSVLLREFLSKDEKSTACTVINGGGFAVLSRHNTPIVIEKVKNSKINKLIKSGDTVMFKMFQTKAGTNDIETRYLTLHRGRWLKWVTSMPSKNGCFTIFTHESELGERSLPTDETQSSFLTLGGSFTLRHKRWAKYSVGISSEPSADFGGRLLRLYNASKKTGRGGAIMEEDRNQASADHSDEDLDSDKETPSMIGESRWIKPLVLCTQDPQTLMASPKSPIKASCFDDSRAEKVEPETPNGLKLIFSGEHSQADVPAWIEMMDRVQRVRQLAYVVRVVSRNPPGEDPATAKEETFVRLKSGKELAHILNIGQSVEIPHVLLKSVSGTDVGAAMNNSSSQVSLSTEPLPGSSTQSVDGGSGFFAKKIAPGDNMDGYESFDDPGLDIDDDEMVTPTKIENCPSLNDDGAMEDPMSDSSCSDSEVDVAERKKQRGLGKVKKLAKKTVVETGRITKMTAKGTTKLAAKGIKGTGKAGKRLIAPVSRKGGKQPRLETRKRNKESRTGVSKTMKKLGKLEAKSGAPPIFVAGELSATEQSRRTASRVLERMSNIPMQSPVWQRCNDALSSEIGFITEQDTWFLDGDATHLGVKPSKKNGKLVGESIVARCIYESHWREEWCGMYENCLSFYAPLAKSRCHEIFYSDITRVRALIEDTLCPLPGFPILVVETAWQCHYMAFRDGASRDSFGETLDKNVQSCKMKKETESLEQSELEKARFWQGFQTLSETSLSACAAKWAKVSSQQKLKERAILNGRRMAFDSLTSMSFRNNVSKAYRFVEDLLTMALTFSFRSLEQDPESFIEFLDLTSELRFLPLEELDLSSPSAFCLFVNIYHCLLQQALLLSVNGPLHKRSVVNFMRTSCYEIGGDVFSLAELHSCVICGKLSKPINPKPPYIEAPKKSNSYKYYALEYTDTRVHFVLNTSDMACPAAVPVLSHRTLEQQLNASCIDFFCQNNQLVVDAKRKIITLPKVCEIHRNDFGYGDFLQILKECLGEMENNLGNAIRTILEKGDKGVTIRFQHTHEQYHSSLKLKTGTANDQSLEVDYYYIHNLESGSM